MLASYVFDAGMRMGFSVCWTFPKEDDWYSCRNTNCGEIPVTRSIDATPMAAAAPAGWWLCDRSRKSGPRLAAASAPGGPFLGLGPEMVCALSLVDILSPFRVGGVVGSSPVLALDDALEAWRRRPSPPPPCSEGLRGLPAAGAATVLSSSTSTMGSQLCLLLLPPPPPPPHSLSLSSSASSMSLATSVSPLGLSAGEKPYCDEALI